MNSYVVLLLGCSKVVLVQGMVLLSLVTDFTNISSLKYKWHACKYQSQTVVTCFIDRAGAVSYTHLRAHET